MDIDREFNASNLTLPDLLAEAERVRKQMTSHLRFDVQPKAQSLADHRDNARHNRAAGESHEFRKDDKCRSG